MIALYNLILKGIGDKQRTWYNSGIGTYARPSWKSLKHYKQILYHKIDMAIAWSVQVPVSKSRSHFSLGHSRDFEKIVLGAYRWLSDNYEEDDCIFLFGPSKYMLSIYSSLRNDTSGFSRGAFQVRVLSAMIYEVRCISSYLGCKLTTPGIHRLALSIRGMRCRYHCKRQAYISIPAR